MSLKQEVVFDVIETVVDDVTGLEMGNHTGWEIRRRSDGATLHVQKIDALQELLADESEPVDMPYAPYELEMDKPWETGRATAPEGFYFSGGYRLAQKGEWYYESCDGSAKVAEHSFEHVQTLILKPMPTRFGKFYRLMNEARDEGLVL